MGALIEPLGCAYNGIFISGGGVHPGSYVIVYGAGPIGLGAILLLKAAGAAKIIALDVIDERLDIGRSADCDVQLLEDGVSKAHAAIVEKEAHSCAIVDLLSRNGLYVNGKRVSHAHLKLGDRIRIGATEFVFEPFRGSAEALAAPRLDGGPAPV